MAPPHPLRAGEEEWQTVFERLCERFPQVAQEKVADVLREHNGHAGNAATLLRETSSSNVKEPDPDDVEHVSTLLSSPVMFKHACKEQFKAFDHDGNGVLDVDEVIALTNALYSNFGLQTPSQGSIRAFFVAMDENNDGVLSEREFRQFFEMFLRFAYFDVTKLRQLVEKGNQKAGGPAMPAQASTVPARHQRSSPSEAPPMPVKLHAPDSPKRRDRTEHRSHKTRDRELEHGGTSRSHRSQKHRSSHRHESHISRGICGSLRCLAQNGVAYRRTAEYEDRRSDAVCHKGDRVQILEHWVRTSEGWLPLVDLQGKALFHLEEDCASRKAKVCINDRERSQSLEDSRLDESRNDTSCLEESQELDRLQTHDDEVPEWKDRLDRLCERFPTVPRAKILECLRENNGHAGLVANVCREMQA